MKGIVNWYSDKKKQGLIEGKDGKNVMIYEKDIPFLTLLHAGDHVEYLIEKTKNGIKAIQIKRMTKNEF
jgi:cold shock CspA family protein